MKADRPCGGGDMRGKSVFNLSSKGDNLDPLSGLPEGR